MKRQTNDITGFPRAARARYTALARPLHRGISILVESESREIRTARVPQHRGAAINNLESRTLLPRLRSLAAGGHLLRTKLGPHNLRGL